MIYQACFSSVQTIIHISEIVEWFHLAQWGLIKEQSFQPASGDRGQWLICSVALVWVVNNSNTDLHYINAIAKYIIVALSSLVLLCRHTLHNILMHPCNKFPPFIRPPFSLPGERAEDSRYHGNPVHIPGWGHLSSGRLQQQIYPVSALQLAWSNKLYNSNCYSTFYRPDIPNDFELVLEIYYLVCYFTSIMSVECSNIQSSSCMHAFQFATPSAKGKHTKRNEVCPVSKDYRIYSNTSSFWFLSQQGKKTSTYKKLNCGLVCCLSDIVSECHCLRKGTVLLHKTLSSFLSVYIKYVSSRRWVPP